MAITQLRGVSQIKAGTLNDSLWSATAGSGLSTSKLLEGAEFIKRGGTVPLTADWNIGAFRITSSVSPTGDNDFVTKAYADAMAAGLHGKNSVLVAASGNVDIATNNLDPVDAGVALVAGSRVLLMNQTAASANGIYEAVSGSSWVRSADANNDPGAEFIAGLYVFVNAGTEASNGFICTTQNNTTIGGKDAINLTNGTAINFTQFSAATALTAGDGIDITNSVISAVVAPRTNGVDGGLYVGPSGLGVKIQNDDYLTAAIAIDPSPGSGGGLQLVIGAGLETGVSASGLSVLLGTTGGLEFDGGVPAPNAGVVVKLADDTLLRNASGLAVKLDGAGGLSAPTSAGIKLSPGSASGQTYVTNASNQPTLVTLSGDIASVTGAGAVTLATTIARHADFVDGVAASGTIDGSNVAFYTDTNAVVAYKAGSLHVYLNGSRMVGGGEDYTETTPGSGLFTFNVLQTPQTGDVVVVDYRK